MRLEIYGYLMEIKENMLEKSDTAQWCSHTSGEYVWICRMGMQKMIKDYLRIDEVDADGRVTKLNNGMSLIFSNINGSHFYDIYDSVDSGKKILIQRS